MQLDTSIPLQVQPIKFMSPQDQYAAQTQIEQNMLAKQLGQMKLDEANYQTQRRNKLNDLLSQNYSKPEDRESALLQGGFSDEAMKLGKDRRENMKTDAETAEKEFKVKKEKLGVLGSVFGRVAQNPTLDTANQALDYLEQTGIYKPEQIQQWRQQATANPASIKPFAEQAYASAIDADKQLTAQLTAKRDAESARHNRASEGIQIREQNMTDARARDANQGKIAENSTGLRKEFEQLPEVKNYKQALPVFKGLEDATKRDTTQADINIVYGLAKLYDPNSVVREGEYATVANSPNIPDRIKGYANYLAGGGRLTKDVRDKILAEARGRMTSYESEYEKSRKGYEDIATRSGADKTLVFPSAYEPAVKPQGGPKAGTVQDGYRYKGGNPADPKNWEKV